MDSQEKTYESIIARCGELRLAIESHKLDIAYYEDVDRRHGLIMRLEEELPRLIEEYICLQAELPAAPHALPKFLQIQQSGSVVPPQNGERLLLLILRTKEERVNIPGDLEEEYRVIAAKHGTRYAKLWYYKQVAASAWPMVRKAVGWGLLASIGAWIRRII
jgi:hypothetical protein